MHVNDCQADAVMIPVPVLPSVFFLCGSISLLGAINMYDIYIYVLYIYIIYIYQEYIHIYIYGADICSPILLPYFCLQVSFADWTR